MVNFVMSVMANNLLTLLNQRPKTPASLEGFPCWTIYHLEVRHAPNNGVTEQKGGGDDHNTSYKKIDLPDDVIISYQMSRNQSCK